MSSFNSETEAKEVVSALSEHVSGKTFLITGASANSLGAETAISLAAANPRGFIFVGRSQERLNPVIDKIKSINTRIKVTVVSGDMCDNSSLRRAAAAINAFPGTIDSVIFSAGIMAVRDFTQSKDGIESQLAANAIGHFLLFNLIAGKLAKESTFVAVSSQGYELCGVDFEHYNFEEGKTYNPWLAYGRATSAKILLAYAISKKPGVASFAVHPGYVPESGLQVKNGVDTELLMAGFKLDEEINGAQLRYENPVRTLQQGAATIVLAAIDPRWRSKSPAYLAECKTRAALDRVTSDENALKFWELGEKLVGQKFPLQGYISLQKSLV